MAGQQYTKASRSSSSSPRLKCRPNSASKCKYKDSGQQQVHNSRLSSSCGPKNSTPKSSTPVFHGKRRQLFTASPTPSRSVSASPTAKSLPIALKTAAASSNPVKESISLELEASDGSLGVPKITAMPPKATFLPRPPLHWFGEKGIQCQASKQQCRVVSQCLISHLSLSGILVAAQ